MLGTTPQPSSYTQRVTRVLQTLSTALLVREAVRSRGANSQRGVVVVRPGWVGFLPTHGSQNLAGGLALTLAGVNTLEGRPEKYNFEALMAQGEVAFDAQVWAVARSSGGVWQAGIADLAIEKSKNGQVSTAWFNGSLDVVRATLPAATPHRLIEGWTLWENPPPSAEQLRELAKVVAPVCAVLAVPAGALVYGALTEDPWMWLGVVFWLLLPLLFIGMWIKEWRRYRNHIQALASGGVVKSAPQSAVSAWPRGALGAHAPVLPVARALSATAPRKPPSLDR